MASPSLSNPSVGRSAVPTPRGQGGAPVPKGNPASDPASAAAPRTGLQDSDLGNLSDATILLVDDNQQNLELMQAYLESLPCRIRTATDGLEAVRIIEREQPDLVLLDIMMPRMSGFEVCQKIKSNPQTRDIVVIMVTALHELGDRERAVECGTDDFLTKPVNKLELLTRVKTLAGVRLLKKTLDELISQHGRPAPSPDRHSRTDAGQKLE